MAPTRHCAATRHAFAGYDAPAGQLYVYFLMYIRHFGLFLFELFSDYSTQRQTYTAVGKVMIIWPGPAGAVNVPGPLFCDGLWGAVAVLVTVAAAALDPSRAP